MSIGERLKKSRLNKGLTQSQLGEQIEGVTRASVSKWEKEIVKPSGENLLRCSNVLEVDPNWLQFGTRKTTDQLTLRKKIASKIVELLNQLIFV